MRGKGSASLMHGKKSEQINEGEVEAKGEGWRKAKERWKRG